MTPAERAVVEAALALSEKARRLLVWNEPLEQRPDPVGKRLYNALVALEFERAGEEVVASARAGIAAYQAAYSAAEAEKTAAFNKMVSEVKMKTPFAVYQRLWDEADGKEYP